LIKVNKIDKTVNKIDKTVNKIDKTANKIDKTANKIDKTVNKIDKTGNKIDKTVNKFDKTVNKIDKTVNKIDKTDKFVLHILYFCSGGRNYRPKRVAYIRNKRALGHLCCCIGLITTEYIENLRSFTFSLPCMLQDSLILSFTRSQ
jgi:peptidoglycan hydrolase CwlO-like protein